MHLRWTALFLLVIFLIACPVEAQKRRKGDKKKESESVTTAPKSEGGGRRSGRQTTTSTTSTTTTLATTAAQVVEEDIDEEIRIVNEPRSDQNLCPPELKSLNSENLPCICRDELDDDALMIECVALNSSQQMHDIFNKFLLGKRIDALEVRNSTLGSLVTRQTAQAYIGTILMRGNQITDFTADAFKRTDQSIHRLDLTSNQLTRVNFSMFDSFNQLQVLNLGENQLTSIEDAGQAPSLRVLFLYSNKIDTITPRAFQRLEHLEYLDLRWNNLQILAPGALFVTSTRWQLRLHSNQLSTVEEAFNREHMPYLVDLSRNNIGVLTDDVYGPLVDSAMSEGSKLYMDGNPIQCDCSLVWLLKNVQLLFSVVGAKCDGNGIAIADLKMDEFRNCPPPRSWRTPLEKDLAEVKN